MMTHTDKSLRDKLEALPRVSLGTFPTPLHDCPNLTRALGGPRILFKREDLAGLAFGGNKVRKLELFLGDLARDDTDVIVVGSAVQSNFCRQTAAAGARLGIDVVLILNGDPSSPNQGNLLLDRLLGADVRINRYRGLREHHAAIAAAAHDLQSQGRRAQALTGFEPLGAIAFLECALELQQQLQALGARADAIVVSSGTGTQAGLEVGVRVAGLDARIIGVSPIPELEGYPSIPDRLAEVANWICTTLDLDATFTAEEIENTTAFVGEAYGHLTESGLRALRLVAEHEGILLDPVYSAKAMAALISMIESGRFTPNETVVFVHTGGTPALFAYGDSLLA